jgi:hypothetical protein
MKNELNGDVSIASERGLNMPSMNLISILNSDFSLPLYVLEVENLQDGPEYIYETTYSILSGIFVFIMKGISEIKAQSNILLPN